MIVQPTATMNTTSASCESSTIDSNSVTFVRHPCPPPFMADDNDTASCCSSSLGVGTFPNMDDEDPSHSKMDAFDDLDTLVPVDERLQSEMAGQHPALQTVCVMDCRKETRIVPNPVESFCLDNECFTGRVMLLMRTPDVDNPRDPAVLGPTQQRVSEYFKGKKRRFEFQFQIKLKNVPTGPLFLGCEVEQSIKAGKLTKSLVSLLLAMVRRINPGFHYSWGPGDGAKSAPISAATIASGEYEKSHLSFPVEASMDRIIITKPGETPPTLGGELFESPESVKRRRKMGAGSVDWNTTDTYTMCLWSAYADWIKWKSINVPGVSPFFFSRVTGEQPIYLSVYEITSCTAASYRQLRPAHTQKDLKIYTRLEFSHAQKTKGGVSEKVRSGSGSRGVNHSEHSLPDTASVGSDLDTLSRVSHITN